MLCYHIATNESSEENLVRVILETLEDRPLVSNSKLREIIADHTEDTELACNKDSVVRQLQTALRLEWSTLPAYLTTLYSIPHGCNVEIYNLIRLIIMRSLCFSWKSAHRSG